jgi:beta-lactamase family protein
MPNQPSPTSPPQRSARRGRRHAASGVCALAAAVATVFSLGLLDPDQAAAASTPTRSGTAQARFLAQVGTQGKEQVTAAVLDLDAPSRTPTVFGDVSRYDTASIVKVDILAALLLKAQDAGSTLSAKQRTLAQAMIEHSDNGAADTLWRSIGLAPGLKAANDRLGLTSTQGGPGVEWGLTRTTASDQIRLLRAVFTPGSTAGLNARSRDYIRTLMSRVVNDQAWGVSAAGSPWELKNGWLERNTTGLWDVNSIGWITSDGHPCLVVVLSDGSTSMNQGVSLVERAARTAVSSAAVS